MLRIEVGGVHKRCKVSNMPASRTVDVRTLPNPFSSIRCKDIDDSVDSVAAWLQDTQVQNESVSKKLAKLVSAALRILRSGEDVRIQCLYGRHRSRAVAKLVADALEEPVSVVYLDN